MLPHLSTEYGEKRADKKQKYYTLKKQNNNSMGMLDYVEPLSKLMDLNINNDTAEMERNIKVYQILKQSTE